MIFMTKIEPDEWTVVPITTSNFILEVVSLRKVDFGILRDVKQWEDAGEEDEFENEFWQEEFVGSRDIPFNLPQRKKGYYLVFWNSNYSKRIYVAYRLREVEVAGSLSV